MCENTFPIIKVIHTPFNRRRVQPKVRVSGYLQDAGARRWYINDDFSFFVRVYLNCMIQHSAAAAKLQLMCHSISIYIAPICIGVSYLYLWDTASRARSFRLSATFQGGVTFCNPINAPPAHPSPWRSPPDIFRIYWLFA